MVMQEQARRLREPLRWGRREKTLVGAVLALVAAAAIALAVFGLSSGAPARADCIDVTFPSTLGAGYVKGCGAKARRVCASGAYKGLTAKMRPACEHAGFPFRNP
jgi:hypothetical protein